MHALTVVQCLLLQITVTLSRHTLGLMPLTVTTFGLVGGDTDWQELPAGVSLQKLDITCAGDLPDPLPAWATSLTSLCYSPSAEAWHELPTLLPGLKSLELELTEYDGEDDAAEFSWEPLFGLSHLTRLRVESDDPVPVLDLDRLPGLRYLSIYGQCEGIRRRKGDRPFAVCLCRNFTMNF